MKAKDLNLPYSTDEKRPIIDDGVFFIPEHYEGENAILDFSFDAPSVFGKKGAVHVEYCSGNGAWIGARALQEPDILWVAVERRFERVRKIWALKKRLGISNLFIVFGEGESFSRTYLKEGSVDAVYVNFPDPWPKTRHAKNRLIQDPFAIELKRIIKTEGSVVLATDDEMYSEQMIEVMRKSFGESVWEAPYFSNQWPGYGTSFFEGFWRDKGKAIRYMHFKKEKTL